MTLQTRSAPHVRWNAIASIISAAVAMALLLIWPVGAQQQLDTALPPEVVLQIEALTAEKAERTPAQQKLSSSLLQAAGIERATISDDVLLQQSPLETEPGGMVVVDIRADVTPESLARIDALGGSVINNFPDYRSVRARVPLAALEPLAEAEEIQSIRPADRAFTRSQSNASDPAVSRKVNTSEGDVAHRADQARRRFGVDGTGIGIGVLSDGVDSLAARQASGDLPARVTVLPGQSRPGDAGATDVHDEGTAMLEIVHDLAPGADLYFATAAGGQAQFATNIEALCRAGADVIVDDIGYLAAAVFQDDIVAQGVNAAVRNGCIYFSAAGNSGNLNDRTSGVWEGDFVADSSTGSFHLFTSTLITNRITSYTGALFCLKWSDPFGASSNDYDLLLLHPSAIRIVWSSVGTQNGTQDPIECIPPLVNRLTGRAVNLTNYRIVIAKTGSAAKRFMHLNTNRGRLQFATAGQTYGHSAAANAIGVAATDATRARGAGGVFNGTEEVERFSSDGPRRIFFHSDGRAITPGNFLSSGGLLLQKPDATAADGVSTATPGFDDFHGTSAAAPHAAAIAALILQAAGGPRSLTRAQLLRAMQDTALDIEAPGAWDRDSGAGIIDAFAAVTAVGPTNGPPIPVGTLPDQRLEVRGGPVMVDVASAFGDPDGDALTYGATSSNAAVAAVHVSGSTVTITPAIAGTATITVTATDVGGSNMTATQRFTTTVTDAPPNSPPAAVGTLPDLTLHVSSPAVVNVTRAFRDPEGDALTYRATSSVVTVATVGVAGARVTVTPVTPAALGAAGATTILVTATDEGGSGTSATQRFTVTVPDGSQFTDRPIRRGTPIRAIHFLELRDRIDALRVRENLSRFQWTDPIITAGVTPVKLVHLMQLRAALDEVYDRLGRPRPSYTDAAVTVRATTITATHVMELRAAVVALE